MATKLKELMEGEPASIVDAVAASAQQIWQAGLGAFAAAQRDGGELFDKLVRDGTHLHQLTQDLAAEKLPGVSGTVGRLAGQIGKQASGSWEKIEKIFDDRVGRSLDRLDIPSRAEFARLHGELDE
ncbi:phasin family protein, partial [Zemynaea arenosa]